MKGKLISLMLILMASVVFTSCDKQKKELKESVEKFNKECPMPIGDIGSINSLFFDDETIEMKLTCNETYALVSSFSNHKQDVTEMLCLSLTKDSSKELVEKIIATGVSFRIVFVGNQTGQRAEFTIPPKELEDAVEKYSNMNDKQKLIVMTYIGSKIKLPVVIDEITKLVGLSLTEDALVYKYELNDEESGESLGSFGGLMKAFTMSQLSSQITQGGFMGERNQSFFRALVDCGQCVKAEYYEINTGNSTSFEISISELKDILSGKYQKNAPTMEDWNKFGEAIDALGNLFEDREEEVIELGEYDDYDDDLFEGYATSPVELFESKISSCRWLRNTSGNYSFMYPDFMEYNTSFVLDAPGDVEEFSWRDVQLAYWSLLGYWAVNIAERGNYITSSTQIANVTYSAKSKGIYSGYTTDGRIYYLKTKVLDGGEVPHVTVLALIYPKEFKEHMQELTEIVLKW